LVGGVVAGNVISGGTTLLAAPALRERDLPTHAPQRS
jgi:hypothetical protein